MSQYPSPYLPPHQPGYWSAGASGNEPARRAGLLLILLGVVGLLPGLFCVGFSQAIPWDKMKPEQAQQLRETERKAGMSMESVTRIAGVVTIVPSLGVLVIGFLARSGTRGKVLAALITAGIAGAGAVVLLLVTLLGLLLGADPSSALCQLMFLALIFALFVLAFNWLLQGYKLSAHLPAQAAYQRQYAEAYQRQYAEYVRQQQAYMQQPQQQPPPAAPPPPQPPPGEG